MDRSSAGTSQSSMMLSSRMPAVVWISAAWFFMSVPHRMSMTVARESRYRASVQTVDAARKSVGDEDEFEEFDCLLLLLLLLFVLVILNCVFFNNMKAREVWKL